MKRIALIGLFFLTFVSLSEKSFAQFEEDPIKIKLEFGASVQTEDALFNLSLYLKLPTRLPIWLGADFITRPWGKSVLVEAERKSFYQFKEEMYGLAFGPEFLFPLKPEMIFWYSEFKVGFMYFNRRGTDKFDETGFIAPKFSTGILLSPSSKFGLKIGWEYFKIGSWKQNMLQIGFQTWK